MSRDYLKIPADRPLVLKRLIETLNSGPKLTILSKLLDKGPLTAKELAKELGVKLPTILAHLSDLVKAGLVSIEYDGRQKKYRLVSDKLVLEIDLRLFLHLKERIVEERLREIEDLAMKYIELKRMSNGLPLTITVKDVVAVLGVDRNTAIEIVDYINTYTDTIIEALACEAMKELFSKKKVEGLTIKELAKELNIHYYWAALVIQSLRSKGLVEISYDGKISILK